MHIDVRHPALPGHFPRHPVVPGVVLLDAVVNALPAHAGRAVRATGFPAVKFLAPLGPGQEFEVRFRAKRADQASFEVLAGDICLCSGTVSYGTD